VASFKIVVTGPFNSGKTQFVQTASDIPVVSTEKRITTEDRGIKAETTVAMDYGRLMLDGDTIYLYGTPGQVRFDFMWELLSERMDAFLVLVDSTDPHSFPDAAEFIRQFSAYAAVPYLVVSNKSDLPGAAKVHDVRRGAQVDAGITVIPCNAKQKYSVRQVLKQALDLLKQTN
jgi:uncharacterized protein